ncbi:MAG: PhzF family phenazine biosynthesis protein [Bacteroidota bacterium]
MHTPLPIFQVDAFTDELFGGNPAAVIPCPKFPEDELMQHIAAENNLSETAFVVAAGKGKFKIRWFTPLKEVRLCGHATLAAAHVLFTSAPDKLDKLIFLTKDAGKLVVTKIADSRYALDLPTDKIRKAKVSKNLRRGLGLEPVKVLQGQDDLLVILSKKSLVKRLEPRFEYLARIKKRGIVVTAPGGRNLDFVSRCFYPRYGILEDPVTGSAHTLLTPYWAKRLKKNKLSAEQISKRKGKLECQHKGKRVRLIGSAVTYSSGQVFPISGIY